MQATHEAQRPTTLGLPPRPRRASDLSDLLATWLRRSRDLVSADLHSEFVEALDAFERRRTQSYRMVVVGEHNSGKSRLLNRLLQRDIAPEGFSAPAQCPFQVVASNSGDQLVLRRDNGETIEETLDTFDVDTTRHVLANTRGLICLEARVESEWLAGLRAKIYEIPGLIQSDPSAQALELNDADMAIIVMSGLYPMSLAETRFLEDQLVGRHIPRILVLVTQLDRVSAAEKTEVLDLITAKVEDIDPSITVLPTFPTTSEQSPEEAFELVRKTIESMSRREDRVAWRGWQISAQLVEVLDALNAHCQQALSGVATATQQKRDDLDEERLALRDLDRQWEDIRLELGQRHLELGQTLRQRLEISKMEIVERLEYHLSRAGDPKLWWERDLPYRLRQELAMAARTLESLITQTLNRDAQTLEEHLIKTFQQPAAGGFATHAEIEDPQAHLSTPKLANLETYRLIARLGTVTGLVAGAAMFSGIAGAVVAAGVVMAAAGEQALKSLANRQRARATEALIPVVERALETYQVNLGSHLRDLYDQLIETAMERRTIWRQTQAETLETKAASGPYDEEQAWIQTLQGANDLVEEIRAVLESQASQHP